MSIVYIVFIFLHSISHVAGCFSVEQSRFLAFVAKETRTYEIGFKLGLLKKGWLQEEDFSFEIISSLISPQHSLCVRNPAESSYIFIKNHRFDKGFIFCVFHCGKNDARDQKKNDESERKQQLHAQNCTPECIHDEYTAESEERCTVPGVSSCDDIGSSLSRYTIDFTDKQKAQMERFFAKRYCCQGVGMVYPVPYAPGCVLSALDPELFKHMTMFLKLCAQSVEKGSNLHEIGLMPHESCNFALDPELGLLGLRDTLRTMYRASHKQYRKYSFLERKKFWFVRDFINSYRRSQTRKVLQQVAQSPTRSLILTERYIAVN